MHIAPRAVLCESPTKPPVVLTALLKSRTFIFEIRDLKLGGDAQPKQSQPRLWNYRKALPGNVAAVGRGTG